MQVKHRVVVMKQELDGSEKKETIHPWMSPSAAEYLSDKEALRVAEDPLRYVTIESNEKEEATSCPL